MIVIKEQVDLQVHGLTNQIAKLEGTLKKKSDYLAENRATIEAKTREIVELKKEIAALKAGKSEETKKRKRDALDQAELRGRIFFLFRTLHLSFSDWNCEQCKNSNGADMTVCYVCEVPRANASSLAQEENSRTTITAENWQGQFVCDKFVDNPSMEVVIRFGGR